MNRVVSLALIFVLMVSGPLAACLWDYDTLAMETKRFPGILELITGKFVRHSQPFYQWRIKDRQKKLADSNIDPKQRLAWLDDLAVAYDKTGEHQLAIDTMTKKEELQPGLYTTAANLGTFYIHSGRLQEGLKYIDQALLINPEAHFGRERYQRLLVKYVLEKRKDSPSKLPLVPPGEHPQIRFDRFIIDTVEGDDKALNHKAKEEEIAKAIKGVSGMMRFGNYDSPILLEALGDLLASEHATNIDAKRLSCRAFLQASLQAPNPEAAQAYRKLAVYALDMQTVSKLSSDQIQLRAVESIFQTELEDAAAWYRQVAADEAAWIEQGIDVDAAFDAKYYRGDPPTVKISRLSSMLRLNHPLPVLIGAGVVVLALAGILIVLITRRRPRDSSSPA